jgi:hypothetical protein
MSFPKKLLMNWPSIYENSVGDHTLSLRIQCNLKILRIYKILKNAHANRYL